MKKQFTFIITIIFLLSVACQSDSKKEETYSVGTTNIYVDESFEPIIDDQYVVFKSSYPNATINMVYRPENSVLHAFLNDSVKVAILSRLLTDKEKRAFENKKIVIRVNKIATDAIALVVKRGSIGDTTATVDDIIHIMKGEKSNIKSLVFDNANSSTVRYLMELSKVDKLPVGGVYAVQSSPDVIKYVHAHPGTIGVISANWIEQPDKSLENLVSELKYLQVKNVKGEPGSDKYYYPDQSNLALGLYPLKRDIYIINCQGSHGLGAGFASFMASERGQRIVLKSGLLPDKFPTREILMKDKL